MAELEPDSDGMYEVPGSRLRELADDARELVALRETQLEPHEARALLGQRESDPGYSRAHAALGWSKLEAIARESDATETQRGPDAA